MCALISLRNRRDAIFMTSEAAPLPSRPFNHLSVLAYLAIGIVVFASSVVAGYLIHSCYRSASRKDVSRNEFPTIAESGTVYRGRSDRGEVELKPLAREFASDEETFLSDSRTAVGKRSDLYNGTFMDPLHLVYSSDSTVAFPSCRRPSPLSPSPVQFQYAEPSSYSPVSPSPSFFCGGLPPSILLPYDERDAYVEHQTTCQTAKAKDKGTKRHVLRPATQFDSNNIRYIPQLEPCIAESTVKLYKEPKLSPVHGSIFPSPGDSLLCPTRNHGSRPGFSQDILAKPSSTFSTPIPIPQRRGRVISGDTVFLSRLPGSHHKENTNPISSPRIDQQYPREPVLPIVRLKPGPGYF